MKISRLRIKNFRGVNSSELLLPDHVVLIGDNNTGKSTVFEAIDLVLGPDRLNRRAPIDEHDFYLGKYQSNSISETDADDSVAEDAGVEAILETPVKEPDPKIDIEAVVTNLSDEQKARFRDHIEWWNKEAEELHTDAPVEGVDAPEIIEALRVCFVGEYDHEEDDFDGKTFFARSLEEGGAPQQFKRKDKQICGFLYLRTLRTGSRALSLEHGSLLDIILRLKEIRPQMWDATISQLDSFDVASDSDLGISGVLQSINKSLKKYVPKEWGAQPHLKVSSLTRDHLRKVVTAFVATGEGEHAAPFYRQGTGTINMLVLAMLSQIAEDRQNVIFAMEEPEIAVPPYAQKRIVHEVRKLSAQSLFTSHSPYVLEEFDLDETVVLARSSEGELSQAKIELPESVKHKRYRQQFRIRFCEGLLSRRILLAEGATEAASMSVASRRLSELDSAKYSSFEALGICIIDAGSETQIGPLADLYRGLGKTVYGVCDKQSDESKKSIEEKVDTLFMHKETGFEHLVLKNTPPAALERFSNLLDWPRHLLEKYPDPKANLFSAIGEYFKWSKGNWGLADYLGQCSEEEIPEWIRTTCAKLKELCEPSTAEEDSGDIETLTAKAEAAPVAEAEAVSVEEEVDGG